MREWLMPRLRRFRRQDVLAGSVVAIVIVGAIGLAAFVQIERDFRPEGGYFGLPTHIHACGRSYIGPGRTYTAPVADGSSAPVVLEPVLGELPLFAYFGDHRVRLDSGEMACQTLVFLHVGAHAYVAYGLEGGP